MSVIQQDNNRSLSLYRVSLYRESTILRIAKYQLFLQKKKRWNTFFLKGFLPFLNVILPCSLRPRGIWKYTLVIHWFLFKDFQSWGANHITFAYKAVSCTASNAKLRISLFSPKFNQWHPYSKVAPNSSCVRVFPIRTRLSSPLDNAIFSCSIIRILNLFDYSLISVKTLTVLLDTLFS